MKPLTKTKRLAERAAKNFLPPKDVSVQEYADSTVMLSTVSSAMPGHYRSSLTPYMIPIMNAFSDPEVESIYVVASSQVGKALDVDTDIPTPNGFVKMGALKVGDVVFDENGKQCNVTFVTDIMFGRKCYEVVFSDGSKVVADAEHMWYVESDKPLSYPKGKNKKAVYNGVVTTEQMLNTYSYVEADKKVRHRYAIPINKGIECAEKELLIKPYTLGVWLGDGDSYSAAISGHLDDCEIIENIKRDGYAVEVEELENQNCRTTVKVPYNKDFCLYGHNKTITGTNKKGACKECARIWAHNTGKKEKIKLERTQPLSFGERLDVLNLRKNKHIPAEYLRASVAQRYELLQGIMDTDGYCGKNGRCEITLTLKPLIDGVCELLASLGIKYTLSTKDCKCATKGYEKTTTGYRVSFLVYNDKQIFKLRRKQERLVSRNNGFRRTTETERRRIVGINPVETRPVRCIQVDSPNHLYLCGKTMIPTHNTQTELLLLAYCMEVDPCGVIFAVPTIKDAEDFMKDRIKPMIEATPSLKKLFGKQKSRDGSQTLQQLMWAGGVLNVVGVNVASQLASKPRRVIIGDEIARWTNSANGEGSPWKLLKARTLTFFNRKLVAVSTPLDKECNIVQMFKEGTQEYWSYPCPNCGKYHHIVFHDIRFEHTDTQVGSHKTINVDWVKWKCPDCGEMFSEQEMKNQSALAKYIAENPEAKKNRVRSFWLNGFCSPFPNASWNNIVLEFLEAGKDPEKLQTVFNTLLGETWENRGELKTEDDLMNRREEYDAEIPDGVLFLTCAVDTQDNRLEYEVKGWGHFKENWGIKKGIIMGRPDNPVVWERLDDVVDRRYKYKDGTTIMISITLVDSGGHFVQDVYARCRARASKRVFPIKGADKKDLSQARPFILPPSKVSYGPNGVYKTWLYVLGVYSGKRAVQDFLSVEEPGAMFCHFPLDKNQNYNHTYFNGLLSEVETRKGNFVSWDIIPGHERNEPFDLFVYNYAALMIVDPDMDALERRRYKVASAVPIQKKKRSVKRSFDEY